jgi:hypothetical protein
VSRVDSLVSVEDWEQFFDSFKEHLAPVAFEAGPSVSVVRAADTVHPEQTAWARQMPRRIYEPVKGKVYVAHGYQLCSTAMLVGDDIPAKQIISALRVRLDADKAKTADLTVGFALPDTGESCASVPAAVHSPHVRDAGINVACSR